MRKFCEDYFELCKESGKFYKEHWKGVIVMNAVVIGAEFAWFFRDQIKETIKDKLEEKGYKKVEEEA